MYKRLAKKMCDEIQERLPLSPKVVEAMSSVNREIFVPPAFAHLSYQINALPMVDSQWISSPLTVAQVTEYLAPNGGDSVLEIGCGSGYQAMVLSKMFRRVFSIERIDKLLCEAKDRFRALQVHNIFVKLDDGQRGWAEYAPFDAILFSACAREIPQAIINQLEDGGVIVAPMFEGGRQIIKRFRKSRGGLDKGESLGECLFVDVQNGIMR
ncbi:protein-L-isoaspartate(D-aspartate) O-methyltransferase [Helicobacter labetoulli]|uniref:protein-L-isoaspartate(D-aspartate) O-methyltransferase n=1 Tax=Helicobacter labetoulli TaxID=2315333 RepID=UPI000EF68F8C|nr:protein-L-isoaspartate(D-aspartate) O-methyltransferase [Helicobacter labetoulli]